YHGHRMRLSRNFLCALFGIAMTLFSWYSPWAWPAAPAFGVMRLLVGAPGNFADLPYAARAAVFVVLIIVNVAAWALAALAASVVLRALSRALRSAQGPPSPR